MMYSIQDRDIIFDQSIRKYTLRRIHDLDAHERPREKLLKDGPESLSSSELLAVIFGVGTKKEDVLSMTSRILGEYGNKGVTYQKDAKKLSDELGIPESKAAQIVATFALGRRFFDGKGKNVTLRTAKDVYAYLVDMRELRKEQFRGLYLNSRYQLIHDEVISLGSLTSNVVHPREVFRPAIERSAVAVILAHNHPSGSPEPSESDILITQQLLSAGSLLGIDVLDHVVVTKNGFSSIPVNYI